ncbi:hypothetical protein BY996DRAFT_6537254 [Phakopsora pachyrhizi]|nr:hypothetical protein BY996DRAFT_6537254 [Phakopsora pachyrhizi]
MEESKQNWIHKVGAPEPKEGTVEGSYRWREPKQFISIGERLGQNMKSGGKVTKVRLNAGHT